MEGSHLVRFLLSCYGIALIAIPASTTNDEESSGRIVYDQRQSGKYNIHVSIKDVAIIEMDQNDFLDESINDEDYYYDENDLTVKPLPSWITKPITTAATSSMSTLSNLQQNDTTTQSTVPQTISQSPITIPLITRYPPNSTYSPNLLADLAATQAASTVAAVTIFNASSSTTKRPPSTKRGTKKTTNVVILATSPTISTTTNATSTQIPVIGTSELKGRSKNASPMHIVMEPVVHPKEHKNLFSTIQKQPATTEEEMLPARSIRREDNDSKIFKFKVRRAHKQAITPPAYPIPYRYRSYGQRRCRSGHFLDESGNCRVKRSSSVLRKLFSMLVSLPFNEAEDADDVEE